MPVTRIKPLYEPTGKLKGYVDKYTGEEFGFLVIVGRKRNPYEKGWVMNSQEALEIVAKDKGAGIRLVTRSRYTHISWAKRAIRVKSRYAFTRCFFHLTQPGAPGAVRRNQYPLSSQWVETSVGLLVIDHRILPFAPIIP